MSKKGKDAEEDEDLDDMYEYVEDEDDEEGNEEGHPSETKEWEWTPTNIGAVMSMVGLILGVGLFALMILSGILLHILILPAVLLIVIGYGLVVKDHLDNKKRDHGRSFKGKGSRIPSKKV